MFEDVSSSIVLNRMMSRVSNKLDKREGAVIFDTLSPVAHEFQFLYIELERIIKEAYGDTASREFLVLRCGERGITPYAAEKAVLRGVFTPANIDVTGKRFNIGDINYTVSEMIGEGEFKVICETAGAIGNKFLGELTPIDYVEGLETAELTEILIPGEDEEDTEALRKRYFDSFDEKAYGGNVRDYLEKTNALPGVGSCKVTRAWNGDIKPSEMIPDNAVKAWYESISGTLTGGVKTWLDTVYTAAEEKKLTTGGTVLLTLLNSDFGVASDALVESVQTAIDPDENSGEGFGIAPIGHVVKVKSAEGVQLDITTTPLFDTGYGWNNLKNSIETAIEDYFLELRKEWADSPFLVVRISQIETRLLGIKGITDIDNTMINGSAENLTLGEFQVPVFGGVGQ